MLKLTINPCFYKGFFMVDQLILFCYNISIINHKGVIQMETNTIIVLVALAYGLFLGYCAGRAVGYSQGADMVREIYRK